MEFCWALPVVPTDQYQELYRAYTDQALRAEKNNFDGVLVSSTPTSVDPFIASTKIGLETTSIRILLAQNTNHCLPTYTAKALNTLNQMINHRADVNVITGSSSIALSREAHADPHTTRYQRTKEFMEIIQLLRKGTSSYKGEFFHISNCDIYPKENVEKRGRYFVAGSSEEAMKIAAHYGDAYILYACEFELINKHYNKVKQMALEKGRSISCGVLVDIIARQTSEEAWHAANELLENTSPITKRMTRAFLKTSDSVGLGRYKDLTAENNYMVGENLWGGLSQVNPSNSISIVGSYEEVIKTLKKYHDAGAEFFLLTSLLHDNEIERIGQNILPQLKKTRVSIK
ncbi:LLM class flavin-dependent oxidoreductase [Brevibacillus laterosporus]|uniref:LLM class flavin-dependent oxidoreductase n=1 Tax=Brevibacillus laterosporus TaxID=1465 RepID=A0AAP8QGY8_BRELA|nr:LLM class flavin-dependent oxidoreductase [Brevibacillus laterosporus]PPB13016.1 LLM class flavin-dependent oxidoreductase [Brevibacillus laterosporus]